MDRKIKVGDKFRSDSGHMCEVTEIGNVFFYYKCKMGAWFDWGCFQGFFPKSSGYVDCLDWMEEDKKCGSCGK